MIGRVSSRAHSISAEGKKTPAWFPRGGMFCAIAFTVTALAALQTSLLGKSLLFCLPSYALIALVALIAVGILRCDFSEANFACLLTTGAFFGYLILRALTSPEVYAARADLYALLSAVTVYGLTTIIFSNAAARMTIIVSLLTLAICHVFVQLVQFGIGENFRLVAALENLPSGDRASGLYANPDHLAGLFEILGICGLSIACWSRWPNWARVLVGYLALVSYFGLALTASRGGYASAAFSLCVFGILSLTTLRQGGGSFKKSTTLSLVFAFAVIVAGFFSLRQSPALNERVSNLAVLDQTRLDLWHAAIEQWELRPIVGTGSGTYRFYGREFRAPLMQLDPVMVHNDYLHLLCEYGLLGGIGFLLFFGAHLRAGWRTFLRLGPQRLGAGSSARSNRLALNLGALAAIAGYVLHSAVDFNLHIPANALLMAFVFGLLANPGLTSNVEPHLTSRPPILFRILAAAFALVLLLQSLRLLPGEYFAEQARVALADEKPAEAISLTNRALDHERHNPNIYFYQGRAFEALADEKNGNDRVGYFESALAAFDHAHQLSPLDGSYPLDTAFVFDELQRFPEAEWMYDLARRRDPHSNMIRNLYRSHLDRWKNAGAEAELH